MLNDIQYLKVKTPKDLEEKFRKEYLGVTNRERCIQQWEWIVKHNSNKDEWAEAHPEAALMVKNVYNCFACLEAYSKNSNAICPVLWDHGNCVCEGKNSEYNIWRLSKTRKNAQAVLDTIKRTWSK